MDNILENIPPWSLGYVGGSIGLAALTSLNLVSPLYFVLFFDQLFRGQIWRLLTAYFFAGQFSFSFFTHVLFSYHSDVCSHAIESCSFRVLRNNT